MSRKAKNNEGMKQKLARLAATVRADAETLVLGPQRTPNASGNAASPPASRLSLLAKRLNPRSRRKSAASARKPAQKHLKKLAQQMAKGTSVMKIRRSRLPAVVALLVAVLGCAGFLIYRSVHLPKVRVAHVAKGWLDSTSGHHPKKHVAVHGAHKRVKHALAHVKHHGKKQLAHRKHKKHAHLAKHKHQGAYQTASYKQAE